MKAAANSPDMAQRRTIAATEYAARRTHRRGDMVLTRVKTASFANNRLGMYNNAAAYSDWTQSFQACLGDSMAHTLSSEDRNGIVKDFDGLP